MAMSLLHVVGFVGFVLSCCFHGASSACSDSDLGSCAQNFSAGAPPADRTEFDQYCQRAATAESCLKKLDCEGTEFGFSWKLSLGSMEGIAYLCSNDAREVYLNNMQCGINATATSEARNCIQKFTNVIASTTTEQICSALNEVLKCIYGVMKNRCGEDAARVYWTYNKKTYSRLAGSTCTIDQSYVGPSSGNGSSKTTVSMTSSVLLLIVASLLIGR